MEPLGIDLWIWWLVVAGLLVGAELMTGTFVLAMLGVGAGAAAVTAGFGAGLPWQLGAFAVTSALMLAVVRPIANRHANKAQELRTGMDAIRGSDAVVLETVTPHAGTVRIGGEVWTARPFDRDSTYEPGETLMVLQIDGATALVG